MTNTLYNSNNILVFDDSTYEAIVGAPSNNYVISDDGILDLFGGDDSTTSSNVLIDKDLLPSTPAIKVDDQAKLFLERNGISGAVEELLSISTNTSFDSLIDTLIDQAKPNTWTLVDWQGNVSFTQSLPDSEHGIIFDVETFVQAASEYGSPMPIVAQAIGKSGLWMWLHQSWDGTTEYTNTFVSLGNTQRTIVAHNSSYDFARISERFQFNQQVFAIDTMSMVNAVHGLDSSTRMALMSKDPSKAKFRETREGLGCAKSLVAAYNFVVEDKLKATDKKARNIFVDATDFQEFIDNKYQLLKYSMLDVVYTLELFQKLYVEFIEWSNGYSVLAGQIMVADALLPVADDRLEWIQTCDDLVQQNNFEVFNTLLEYAKDVEEGIDRFSPEEYSELHKLDWKAYKPKGWRKKHLPEGWPKSSKWYHSFLMGEFKLTGLDLPRLLMLRYDGHLLKQHRSMGWYYTHQGLDVKLPHKSGNERDNVGSPISSDALRWIEDNDGNLLDQPLLTSDLVSNEELHKIMVLLDSCTTWNAFRDRVKNKITL